MNIKCDIGYCVWVLYFRLWNTNKTNPTNMSRIYWKDRLRAQLKETHSGICNLIPGIYNKDGNLLPNPIPYEQEYNL